MKRNIKATICRLCASARGLPRLGNGRESNTSRNPLRGAAILFFTLACLCFPAAADEGYIIPRKITVAELAETTIPQGVLVRVIDGATPGELRVGDGFTVGGLVVGDGGWIEGTALSRPLNANTNRLVFSTGGLETPNYQLVESGNSLTISGLGFTLVTITASNVSLTATNFNLSTNGIFSAQFTAGVDPAPRIMFSASLMPIIWGPITSTVTTNGGYYTISWSAPTNEVGFFMAVSSVAKDSSVMNVTGRLKENGENVALEKDLTNLALVVAGMTNNGISQAAAYLAFAPTNEVPARILADGVLITNIAFEASARLLADGVLTTNISLKAEITGVNITNQFVDAVKVEGRSDQGNGIYIRVSSTTYLNCYGWSFVSNSMWQLIYNSNVIESGDGGSSDDYPWHGAWSFSVTQGISADVFRNNLNVDSRADVNAIISRKINTTTDPLNVISTNSTPAEVANAVSNILNYLYIGHQ